MSSSSTSPAITETLASGVPGRATGLAYGPPQELLSSQLVPVALVTYGFGGSDDSDRWGRGGGGGGVAVPIGAYVNGANGPRFQSNPLVFVALAIALVFAVGHVITQIVKHR